MVNSKFYKLIIFSGLVLLATSCIQNTIVTTDESYEEKYFLSDADTTKGSIYISLIVEMPISYKNMEVSDSIRSAIFRSLFGNEYAKMGVDTVLTRFADDLKKEYKLNNEPLISLLEGSLSLYNEHILEGFSLLKDENIFSYGINRYVFMGGAHGLNSRLYLNFDMKTGKQITERDLFKEGTDSLLVDLIKTRIVEERQNDPDLEPISKLEDSDYWVDAIRPNGNFYITDQSINYVFNPYEIAPYYMGQTEVTLPFDRIKTLLVPNSVIDYLLTSVEQ